jgi:hypothetical protein
MAVIRSFEARKPDRIADHSEAEATYSIVVDQDGTKYLQLDTLGSRTRKLKGKVSQSLRLAPSAIDQLRAIINRDFPS